MKHYNRLNDLLIEFTTMSQSENVPNLEKTVYAELVDFCIYNKDLERGLIVVDSAIQLFSSAPEFTVKKIEILLLLKQPEQALDTLDSIEHLNRLSRQAQILKAKALKATGKDKDALDIIHGLEDTKDKDFDVYELQASLLENLNQFENLYHLIKSQILMAPKEKIEQLLEKYSFFTEITSNYTDAIDFYDKVIDLYPFSSTAWQNLGQTQAVLGNYEEAVDAFEYCIAINPTNRAAYFGCADCFEKADRFDLALTYYNEYIDATHINDADALIRLANCFYNMDEFDSAKHWLEEAIQIDPNHPEAFYILGMLHQETDAKKAINNFEEAMDIDPFNETYMIALAELHFRLNNNEDAIQFFQQAVDTAPDVIETWIPYIRFLVNTKQKQLLFENLEEVSTYFNQEKVIFLKIAGLFAVDKRKEAKYWLAETLATYDESPELLFKISPALSSDQEVKGIIKKYRN